MQSLARLLSLQFILLSLTSSLAIEIIFFTDSFDSIDARRPIIIPSNSLQLTAQPYKTVASLTSNVLFIQQMIVGLMFIVIGSLNINRKKDQTAAIILNDIILVLIFVISLVNVIISGFGIEYSSQPLHLLERENY